MAGLEQSNHTSAPHAQEARGQTDAWWRPFDGLTLAFAAGAPMAAAYFAGPSPLTAFLLLAGMALAAWNFQRQEGRRRWTSLVLTLIVWQAGSMGWITAVLGPELGGAERVAATALLFVLLWALSLGSLLLLGWGVDRLLDGRRAQPLAWPLAWWIWMVSRDFCWWGGGYGSLSLPLLTLPGLGTWLPLLGPALFEATLWALLLAATQPSATALRRVAGMALLALALALPSPWTWTAPAGEGLSIAVVETPPVTAGPSEWTLQARDEALAAIHRTVEVAPTGSLVVTPEGFMPESPPNNAEGVWGDLLNALDVHDQRLLLGTSLSHPDPTTSALMNVAMLVTPHGDSRAASVYAKQRLAPIGEELPWPALLKPLSDRWLNHARRVQRQAGPPAMAAPLVTGGATLGMLLCHEVAFSDGLAATANGLVHLASDHWSDDPRSARQALGLARLRAIESGKWLLSVSEGQPAQLIDPQGRMRNAQRVDALPLRQGHTPFVHWRALQPIAPLALLAALLLAARRARGVTPSLAGITP